MQPLITVNKAFGRSVVCRVLRHQSWSGLWVDCDEHSKYVSFERYGVMNDYAAFQLQPFEPGEVCSALVYPIDWSGKTMKPFSIPDLAPTGKWEATVKAACPNFVYDASLDTPMGRPNPSKLFVDYFCRSQDTIHQDPQAYSVPDDMCGVNDQYHWHTCMRGQSVAVISVRCQAAFRFNKPLDIYLDADEVSEPRSKWYVVVSANKIDTIGLTPEVNFAPPPDSFVLTISSFKISADVYVGLTRYPIDINSSGPDFFRGESYRNVRQQMRFRLLKNGFGLFADSDYDGVLEPRGLYPLPFPLPWFGGKVYVSISDAVYHTAKTADTDYEPAHSHAIERDRVALDAHGKVILTQPRKLAHWGMIGVSGECSATSDPQPFREGFDGMMGMEQWPDSVTALVRNSLVTFRIHGKKHKVPMLLVDNRPVNESTGSVYPIRRIWTEDGREWKPKGPHLVSARLAPLSLDVRTWVKLSTGGIGYDDP